jgi:uncharacterized protein with HEPN domain
MLHDPRAYLWDVQQAAEAIDKFTAGHDANSYAEDAFVQAAVERKFGIIGDALNRLSKVDPALAERVPHLRTIVGFRNVLIHGYALVDHARVWHIRATLLPDLHATVSTLLADLGPPDEPARP